LQTAAVGYGTWEFAGLISEPSADGNHRPRAEESIRCAVIRRVFRRPQKIFLGTPPAFTRYLWRGDSAFLEQDVRRICMLKKLMITTALTAFMIGGAAAEGMSPSSPDASKAPAAQSLPATKSSTETTAPAGSAKFVNSQRQDQFLASKFKGTDVVGSDDKKIGDVSDILFDKDGKIEAYVVGVGGFLGIGSKDVALAPSAFQIVPGDKSKNESDKLRLSMTKDELKQAANFEPYKAPSSTTGMGTMGSRPAPARPAPAGAPN
jgi:sporulation protein YlmC with PRC-barrel domain